MVSSIGLREMKMKDLPFDQRACFIAGQAKSGTTLLVALLDNHPELLVLPEETAYFPTVLTKYAPRGRRAQFDYITRESLSNVSLAGPANGASATTPIFQPRASARLLSRWRLILRTWIEICS